MKAPLNMRQVARTVTKIADSAGWIDPHTGLGQRGSLARFCPPEPLEDQQLADLYEFEWLSRRVVRMITEDAWQDSLEIPDTADADRWSEIDYYEGSDDGAFLTAAHWGRLYGLSLLVLGYDAAGDVQTPLPANPKPITWLEPVPGAVVEVLEQDLYLDPANPREYRNPEYYRITGVHRFQGLRIHESRVIPFYGPSTAGLRQGYSRARWKRELAKGTISCLDPVQAVLKEYGLSWSAVSHLLQEASIPIWKLKGIFQALAQSDYAALQSRFQVQQGMLGVGRAVVLDADQGEDYRREAASVNDLPGIVEQLSFRLSAATGIPVGRLFGKVVAGLGDGSAESEQWLQTVGSYRTRTLEPRVWEVMRHAGIAEWSWKPLGSPSEAQQADIEAKRAQTVKTWYEIVAIPDQELADMAARALDLPEWTVEEEPEPTPAPPVLPVPVPGAPPVEPEPEPVEDAFVGATHRIDKRRGSFVVLAPDGTELSAHRSYAKAKKRKDHYDATVPAKS